MTLVRCAQWRRQTMYRGVGMNFFVRHLNFLRPALMQGVRKLGIAAFLSIIGYANAGARDSELAPDEFRLAYAETVANTGDRPVQVGSHYHFCRQSGYSAASEASWRSARFMRTETGRH